MPGPGAPCGDEWVGMYRGEHMKKIPIDVSGCRDEGDVYDLLLAGLEAPCWHGRNFERRDRATVRMWG